MSSRIARTALVTLSLLAAGCVRRGSAPPPPPLTTAGALALENLDGLIHQQGDAPGVEELLLTRARYFADYDSLERAVALAAGHAESPKALLRRAGTRAAAHRFKEALVDIDEAEAQGANRDQTLLARSSILVATGREGETIPSLQAFAARAPGYASWSALAVAYAAAGRFEEADRLYASALSSLDTTSPFPSAWLYYARGLMWSDQAGEPARAERLYHQALAVLPEFAAANIHLAELEMARGDSASAMERLERVVSRSNEPEALGLLGALHLRMGDRARGSREIASAREHFEALLARLPEAFADHAAEFYLGPGADPHRAWELARLNLAVRRTPRSIALARRAAKALDPHG